MQQYWLMKSEPSVYSINDLKKEFRTPWDGIRNYQARNFMRDSMQIGDSVLFYHSNSKPPGIAGIAKIASTPYPDHTALNPKSTYFDPKSTKEKPIWMMVDVSFVKQSKRFIPLPELKTYPQLANMKVIQKGVRLSIQPVTKDEYAFILGLM